MRNYTLGDVVARFRRAAGWRVLYTTGFDAFGLPIENAAREEGCSPGELVARKSIAMTVQLRRLGLSHDPTRVLSDHEPRYYRWVQWVFRALLVNGLAYRSTGLVNWCPQCATTLADNLVEHGRCWRCESLIERVEMNRWFVRETALVDALADASDIEAGRIPSSASTGTGLGGARVSNSTSSWTAPNWLCGCFWRTAGAGAR